MSSQESSKRYVVEDFVTGDQFGNHTYAEACARAKVMCRNWNYKKVFVVKERVATKSANGELITALQRIRSLDEKNVPKYAQKIARDALALIGDVA